MKLSTKTQKHLKVTSGGAALRILQRVPRSPKPSGTEKVKDWNDYKKYSKVWCDYKSIIRKNTVTISKHVLKKWVHKKSKKGNHMTKRPAMEKPFWPKQKSKSSRKSWKGQFGLRHSDPESLLVSHSSAFNQICGKVILLLNCNFILHKKNGNSSIIIRFFTPFKQFHSLWTNYSNFKV